MVRPAYFDGKKSRVLQEILIGFLQQNLYKQVSNPDKINCVGWQCMHRLENLYGKYVDHREAFKSVSNAEDCYALSITNNANCINHMDGNKEKEAQIFPFKNMKTVKWVFCGKS